jgi:mono/diheme cytochrome c family protein
MRFRFTPTTGRVLVISIMSVTCSGGAALAQVGADAAKGRALAHQLCAGCHIVAKEAASSAVPADVPSFAAIARKPGQTAEAVAGRIVVPHPPMPDIQLTRGEIANLAAYILSLKQP